MKSWQSKEVQARRAIEDQGFVAQDANVLFRANCPDIDLAVFGKDAATYVQVKSSQKPAGSDAVIADARHGPTASLTLIADDDRGRALN